MLHIKPKPNHKKKILQTNIETRSQTPPDKVKGRHQIQIYPRIFKKIRFFLDSKQAPQSLLKDIKILGGVSIK